MKTKFERKGNTISFKDHFEDYKTFMDETRDPIYRTILSAFESLKEKERVSVSVKAKVDNTEFESELEFTKSNLDILTDVINPYFEGIEDYESCGEVMKVLNQLKDVS